MPDNAMVGELGAVVIDVSDIEHMATFWSEMLGQEP